MWGVSEISLIYKHHHIVPDSRYLMYQNIAVLRDGFSSYSTEGNLSKRLPGNGLILVYFVWRHINLNELYSDYKILRMGSYEWYMYPF